MTQCVICGENDGLLGGCNYCGATVCNHHRLPESHNCIALNSRDSGALFEGLAEDSETGSTSSDDSPSSSGGVADVRKPDFSGARGPDVAIDGSIKGKKSSSSNDPGPTNDGSGGFSTRRAFLGVLAVGGLGIGGAVATGQVELPELPDFGSVPSSPGESVATTASSDEPAGTSSDANSGSLFGSSWDNEAARNAAHERVNEVREDNAYNSLSWDSRLVGIAQQYAERMAREEFFSHTAPDGSTFEDRYSEAGYNCRVEVDGNRYLTGAENIAYTFYREQIRNQDGSESYYSTPEELGAGVVNQWMNSQGHRENILTSAWRNEGIGIARADNGRIYAVQNFC
ncbi:CAP domain-containing protein [Halobaculum lipolyticum]|uniref:CAP domain-containing protein n=1 Tax=Halobaculum lipolyticum TaxID=3032001 RepID=A0ABD5WEI5_9EURY